MPGDGGGGRLLDRDTALERHREKQLVQTKARHLLDQEKLDDERLNTETKQVRPAVRLCPPPSPAQAGHSRICSSFDTPGSAA